MNTPFGYTFALFMLDSLAKFKYSSLNLISKYTYIKSIDVAINVPYGPPFKRKKDMIASYLQGMDCRLGPP